MNCQAFRENIQRYCVSDLRDHELKDFEEHRNVCDACLKVLRREYAFEFLLRKYLPAQEAPQDLREAVLSSIEKQYAGRPFRGILGFFFKPALAGALIVIVAVAGLVMFSRSSMYAQAVRQHEKILSEVSKADISVLTLDETLQHLSRLLGYDVSKPHLDTSRVHFITVKIAEMSNRRIAQFIYEKDGRIISAFVLPPDVLQTARTDGQVMADNDEGLVMAWNEKGFEEVLCFHKATKGGCLFVSNIPRDEFLQLMG